MIFRLFKEQLFIIENEICCLCMAGISCVNLLKQNINVWVKVNLFSSMGPCVPFKLSYSVSLKATELYIYHITPDGCTEHTIAKR